MRLLALAVGALLGLCAPAARGEESGNSSERAVGFSWGNTSEAQAFELEFSLEGEDGYAVIADGLKAVNKPIFEGKLPPGDYQVRIRSLDQRGVPGPWGSPVDLVVPFAAVELLSPAANKKIKGATNTTSPVTFKWKAVASAPGYQLKILDQQQKVVLNKTISEAKLTTELAVAKDYTWEVRVSDADDELGDAGTLRLFTLLGARLAKPEPQLDMVKGQRVVSWAKVDFAELYTVKLMTRKGKKGPWRQVSKTDSPLTSFAVPLDAAAGSYRFDVTAKADRRLASKTANLKFTIESKAELALAEAQKIVRTVRLSAAYTPVYWRHGAAADDDSGVSFNILMFQAFSLDAEAWLLDDALSLELVFGRWSTVLFGNTLPGSGVQDDQKPKKINGEDLAFKGKYHIGLLPFADLSVNAGVRRSTAFFFYKDTPSTIAVFESAATYLTIGSGLTLQLWQRGELRGWAETDYPLNGQGFKIEKATDYRLNGNLTSFIYGRSLALLFLYQYDYRHWLYELNGLGTSGHVVDSSHTFGAGLEAQF